MNPLAIIPVFCVGVTFGAWLMVGVFMWRDRVGRKVDHPTIDSDGRPI